MSEPLKLLLVGDSDSQLLACEALCRFPEDTSVSITINAIPREGTPEAILDRARALGQLWQLGMAQLLLNSQLLEFDAIGVFLTGSKIAEFRNAVTLRAGPQRPVLFCGFNGVVLQGFEEGISWRLGYDLICLHGPRDQAALERMLAGTPLASQQLVQTGLSRNGSNDSERLEALAERPRRLVFAEQVVMPAGKRDRQRMVRILAELARSSPHWEVLIKPRIAPEESTFHRVTTHIGRTLLETLGHPPPNLRLDYSPLPQMLQQSRLLATVSSTALFDSLDHGCKPIVMADFGLQTSSGSQVFAGSGVERLLAEVENLDALEAELPWPDPEWLSWMGYSSRCRPGNLLEAIRALKLQPQAPLVLDSPGYVVNGQNLSFNQLRLGAEQAIQKRNYAEAASLLELACLLRPTHRNVARRLAAVGCPNRLTRRLRLLLSPRFVG